MTITKRVMVNNELNYALQFVVLLKGDLGNTCLLWQKMIMTQMFEKHVKHRFREMKQLGMHDSLQLMK